MSEELPQRDSDGSAAAADARPRGVAWARAGAMSIARRCGDVSLIATRRVRRFLGSRPAWGVAVAGACLSIGLWNAAPLAWLATGVIFFLVAGWHDALRGFAILHHRIRVVETRTCELERMLTDPSAEAAHSAQLIRAKTVVAEALALAERSSGRDLVDIEEACADESPKGPNPADSACGLTHLGAQDCNPFNGQAQRRTRRLAQELLQSNLGQVLDLSHGGMRVKIEGKRMPRGIIEVELRGTEESVRIQAEVVWTKTDRQLREAGLRFINPDPDISRQITRISMLHRRRATMNEPSDL